MSSTCILGDVFNGQKIINSVASNNLHKLVTDVVYYITIQLLDDTDVSKMTRELNNKVAKLQSNLQRINAPNMKADER